MNSIHPAAIIAKKRDGHELSTDEIRGFIAGFTAGSIHDYQLTALAMAIYCRGMNETETVALTESMLHTGTRLDWGESAAKAVVDKHSTGGVGDKVSIILAPLLASCGLRVPMLSGRGLGPTGGTLDKLEAIPGFRTDLTIQEIQRQCEQIGCVITGASPELAPADRKFYALRDVTGTVSSIPLITASIMSKKLAENLDALVLDVKFGSGALMKTLPQAKELARSLVSVGQRMDVPTTALISNMNQPLGRMVGNAVEVEESLEVLRNEGPEDLRTLTLELGAELLVQADIVRDVVEAQHLLVRQLENGQAYESFATMVATQGGNLNDARPVAPVEEVRSPRSGYLVAVDAESFGYAVIEVGGGRKVQTDRIDHSVGLEMLLRVGDPVVQGQPFARLFAPIEKRNAAVPLLLDAVDVGDEQPLQEPLVVERIGAPA